MLKILQARLQQYMNWELLDVQAGFKKGRRTRDQIANIHWIIEKAREFQKNIYFCFIDYDKAFDCGITRKCGKFLKKWEYQTTWPASWETRMQVKKQQLGPDMEQWTGSKLGNEYIKTVYCHPAYLTSWCRVHHEKCWAGGSTSWNQDCQEKYQQPQTRRWHHPYGRKWRRTKEPLDERERGGWKSWLKAQHSEK